MAESGQDVLDELQDQFGMPRDEAEMILKTAQLADNLNSLRVHLGFPRDGDSDA